MKTLFLFSLLALFIFSCTSNSKQNQQTKQQKLVIKRSTPKELAETLIQTFAKNDIKAFEELLYTKKDIEETLKLYAPDHKVSPELLDKQTEDYEMNHIKVKMVWRRVRNQIIEKQFDWSKVEMVKVDAKVEQDTEVPIKRTNMMITIKSNYREFELQVPNCYSYNKVWKLLYAPTLVRYRTVSPK